MFVQFCHVFRDDSLENWILCYPNGLEVEKEGESLGFRATVCSVFLKSDRVLFT